MKKLLIYSILSNSLTLKRDKSTLSYAHLSNTAYLSSITQISNITHISTDIPLDFFIYSYKATTIKTERFTSFYSKEKPNFVKDKLKLILKLYFHSIYCSLRERYNQYSKHLHVGVLLFGITIITYLLGLSVLHCCILVFFIIIILCVLPFIMVNCIHLPDTLGLLWLFSLIGVYTLTNSVMTAVFHTNYPNLAETDIFLIYLGTARVIMGIFLTNKAISFFDRIKNIIKEY